MVNYATGLQDHEQFDPDDYEPRLSMKLSTTTLTWKTMLAELLAHGTEVAPSSAGSEWRGKTTKELIAYQTVIPMNRPVITSPARKLGMKFLAAEAAWILSGDNRVSTIAPYSARIKQFSDDGRRFFGAYGPRFIEQLSYAVRCLYQDPASRQAVIEIWRPSPGPSKDTPCTLSWQFLVRNGRLDCVATMRSSDAWTGWVYDVFNFSMAAAMVLLELRTQTDQKVIVPNFYEVKLGNLYLTAGSQHLYKLDWPEVEKVLADEPITGRDEPYAALNLDEFGSSEELIGHLWALSQETEKPRSFLKELYK